MTNMQAFWDERATSLGTLAGTQDRVAKRLEMQFLRGYVRPGLRVLDAGCGDGETLVALATTEHLTRAVGVDFSEAMLRYARERLPGHPVLEWQRSDLGGADGMRLEPQSFDLVYTERLLVNLPTWEAQRRVLEHLATLVAPGGALVVVECLQEGVEALNRARAPLDLDPIVPPPHTRYLRWTEMVSLRLPEMPREAWVGFTGLYYFLSRVVHAYEAQARGGAPEYAHPINDIALALPTSAVFDGWAQVAAWVYRRKAA